MTLTEFLLARIAEDEATCEAVAHDSAGFEVWGDPPVWNGALTGTRRGHPHVVMDVSRARAECEAKRRIVERHQPARFLIIDDPSGAPDYEVTRCDGCGEEWPCPDMRDLGSVHADHPDYLAEWRPDPGNAETRPAG